MGSKGVAEVSIAATPLSTTVLTAERHGSAPATLNQSTALLQAFRRKRYTFHLPSRRPFPSSDHMRPRVTILQRHAGQPVDKTSSWNSRASKQSTFLGAPWPTAVSTSASSLGMMAKASEGRRNHIGRKKQIFELQIVSAPERPTWGFPRVRYRNPPRDCHDPQQATGAETVKTRFECFSRRHAAPIGQLITYKDYSPIPGPAPRP